MNKWTKVMELDNRDGDLFLIRYIRQKPIIWDPLHQFYHDREKRDQVFKELSKSTKMNRKLLSHKNKNKMLTFPLFFSYFLETPLDNITRTLRKAIEVSSLEE